MDELRQLAADLLDVGVQRFLTVPGSPGSELVEELERAGALVEDAHNEKTAAELAFGLSIAGESVALVVKGNGALLAAEPLQNAGPHGTSAPLLLLVGDDVDAVSSTVVTDARPLGPLLMLPVFDLGGGRLRRPTVTAAWNAAIAARRPVVLRFTASMLDTAVEREEAPAAGTAHEHRAASSLPPRSTDAFHLSKRSRFVEFAYTRSAELDAAANSSPRLDRVGAGRQGVIAVGATWDRYVTGLSTDRDEPVVGLTSAHPLPAWIAGFCSGLDKVVVLEEGLPFVETAVQLLVGRSNLTCTVVGQSSGHLPPLGPRSTRDVLSALDGHLVPTTPLQPRRPEEGVGEHEFRSLFEALEKVQAETSVEIHTCVGSCISAAYAPYSLATSALNLGGSTGVAAGFAIGTERPSIALIGDYGLVHSGLTAHQIIVQRGVPVLTIVLANGESAKTGGQPSAIARGGPGHEALDLHRLVTTALGPHAVRTVDIDDCDVGLLSSTILELLADTPATLLLISGDLLSATV